ncbi:MAG: hypothetical protein A2342_08850 [Gallionellales bacterium RIFOXYB12_FULL_54_9]|nr:MAG: hypothetical protein A2342_08850 [Gallionellales bacterium RIFOXYB12_FULL_54_9]
MNWIEGIFDRLNLYQLKGGGIFSYLIMFSLMSSALLRILVAPLEAGLQYLTFFPAVALSAIIGGFWPGLCAVFIGMCMATFIFVPPYYSISLHSLQVAFWANMVFLVDGLVVCSAVAAMRRYQVKLNASIDGLRLSEQIIRTTREGFWLCDTGGRILDVNDSYCHMVGYTRDELLSMCTGDLESSCSTFSSHLQRIMECGYDTFETVHRHKNGVPVSLEISVNRSEGVGDTFIVFARDITERVGREAQRLTEVKEQRDVLVREVHHRIKNHLQGVVGLLRQHAVNHPEMAGIIEISVGRVCSIAIIHGLQSQSLSEEVDLDALIKSIVEASGVRVFFENRLVTPVFLNREETVPVALVLNELIANACKHRTRNSQVDIRVVMSGAYTRITIENQFETGKLAAAGHGLNLVKSLLPRKSAHLAIEQHGDVFAVELKLSAPVTIY